MMIYVIESDLTVVCPCAMLISGGRASNGCALLPIFIQTPERSAASAWDPIGRSLQF